MRTRALAGLLLAALTAASGCGIATVHRTSIPASTRSLPRDVPFLKTHLRDGSLLVLSDWKLSPGDSALVGSGTRFDPNRTAVASGAFRVPRDSIVVFETNQVRRSPSVGVYTILWVATAAGTIACLANPKACFGSCPTFYDASDPDGPVQAEGFSASVAPFLEDTDVDALYRVRPRGSVLRLKLTNEALETHYIRHADLLAVPREGADRVARDGAGDYYRIHRPMPPRSARAEEGDCAAALASLDGVERFSPADSTDLSRKETIDLEFADDRSGERGVLLSARQTLLTTFLFYQTLAYLGDDAGRWFAGMERGAAPLRSRLGGLGAAMGLIEVWVKDAEGAWRLAGHAGETGPIATDVYLVRLPVDTPCPAQVQLRMSRGMWRLDSVSLVHLAGTAAPARIEPRRVLRGGAADAASLAALLDSSRTLVTMPGDEYVLEYALPRAPENYEYFLDARGYYVEWMREEWAKEKNPARLVECFLNPAAALRRLAPEYKKLEPGMEAMFWGSRYARR